MDTAAARMCPTCPHRATDDATRGWLWRKLEDNGQDICDPHPCHEDPAAECRGRLLELRRRAGPVTPG